VSLITNAHHTNKFTRKGISAFESYVDALKEYLETGGKKQERS
jgi:hypothetical protein